jgi:hypothetical protein
MNILEITSFMILSHRISLLYLHQYILLNIQMLEMPLFSQCILCCYIRVYKAVKKRHEIRVVDISWIMGIRLIVLFIGFGTVNLKDMSTYKALPEIHV